MSYFLNFRARPVGHGVRDSIEVQQVTLNNGNPVVAAPDPPLSALVQAILGKNLLFVTHGFNVSQDDGYRHLLNWETLLQLDDTYLFLGMVWPGDSSWLGPFCYPGEGVHAIKCGDMLADFITKNFAGANSMSFVSHSLGARFVLETIQKLPTGSEALGVRQIALMAGAINDDCLSVEYANAAGNIATINILASTKDDVLSKAFPVGNIFEGIIDKGHPYFDAALGHKGPDRIILNKAIGPYQIPSSWNYRHHNYIDVKPKLNPALTLQQGPPLDDNAPLPVTDQQIISAEAWQPSWSAAFVSYRLGTK